MSSRKEEKELRREERLAAEKRAKAGEARRRRLRAAGLAAIAAGVVVVAIFVVSRGGSGGGAGPSASSQNGAKIPSASDRDLTSAAKAAGCVLLDPPDRGQNHVTTPVKYISNPPTSGNHNPAPALDGIYSAGKEQSPEHYVHALEHGRVEFQYKPGTQKPFVAQLETLASEPLNGKAAYKILLFENNTNMPYQVAATAWNHLIGCNSIKKPQVFDALRDFRLKYVDKGPELGIPPNN